MTLGANTFNDAGLAAAVIERVPKHRTNEAIVFDAAADHVVPFNPLACSDPARIDQVVSGVVSCFKKLNDSWGPRLENLLPRCERPRYVGRDASASPATGSYAVHVQEQERLVKAAVTID